MSEAILLGIAQDAGVPHIGCQCATCVLARRDPTRRQPVVSLGLVDREAEACWLIDATPDFPAQYHALLDYAAGCALAGILLTHAHIGHYLGLAYLGREAMHARAMPVYATPSVCHFLTANGPWSQLVRLGNIQLVAVTPGEAVRLSDTLTALPVVVPHRAEYSDTVAYLVQGPTTRLFYCPDIDRWTDWAVDVRAFLAEVDVALLDGCFFSGDELPGRNLAEIPHPLVTDTVARLRGSRRQTIFIHLNHSNPLWRDGPERAWLAQQGLQVGQVGLRWAL